MFGGKQGGRMRQLIIGLTSNKYVNDMYLVRLERRRGGTENMAKYIGVKGSTYIYVHIHIQKFLISLIKENHLH